MSHAVDSSLPLLTSVAAAILHHLASICLADGTFWDAAASASFSYGIGMGLGHYPTLLSEWLLPAIAESSYQPLPNPSQVLTKSFCTRVFSSL